MLQSCPGHAVHVVMATWLRRDSGPRSRQLPPVGPGGALGGGGGVSEAQAA